MPKNKLVEFQKERLTQARYHRAWNMAELAEATGLTRQAVSSYERGESSPSPEKLRELADKLNVPESFFTVPVRNLENKKNSISTFRSLASSTAKARNQTETYNTWMVSIAAFVSDYVELPKVDLPEYQIDDYMQINDSFIETIAEKTRKHFSLGNGPISDLTLLLENKGVLVSYVPLAKGIDGMCSWYGDRPSIVISSKFKAVRRRFDLCHELGHLLMHKLVPEEEQKNNKEVLKKIEHDAHRFASAFLMPASSFAQEVYGIDIESLKSLKLRWGVSIQAIVMRLHDLQIISEHQKTRLFQKIAYSGMRKKEPYDDVIPVEKAKLMQRVFEFLNEKQVLPLHEVPWKLKFPQFVIEWATNFTSEEFQSIKPDNVIELRQRT